MRAVSDVLHNAELPGAVSSMQEKRRSIQMFIDPHTAGRTCMNVRM